MSLVATLKALVAAGGTSEMVLAVVRVHEAERDAADIARRARDANRQARRRSLMPDPDEWQALRGQVFERDGYVCTYCGDATEEPHCDHVRPLSKGGPNTIDNLTTACPTCNSSKGARSLEEWLANR